MPSYCRLLGTSQVIAYNASKHAVIGLTKCAALEYGWDGNSRQLVFVRN